MLNRRNFVQLTTALPLAVTAGTGLARAATVGDDGLHVEPWFLESFLELADDRAEAAAQGKHLAVVFEQKGCPYCTEMHEVYFAKPQIADYIKEHFNVLQINLWGSRFVTDFDGAEVPEKELAKRWGVRSTPTIVFLSDDMTITSLKAADYEVARMPGLFKPFIFLGMFQYVAEKHTDVSFKTYMDNKIKALEQQGKKPEIL